MWSVLSGAALSPSSTWQVTVALLVIPVVAAVLTEVVLFTLLDRRLPADREYLRIVIDNIRVPVVTTILLAGSTAIYSRPNISEAVFFTQSQIETFIGNPGVSVIVVIWAFYLNRISNQVVTELDVDDEDTMDAAPLISNIVSIGLVVGAVAVLLTLWEYDITPLLGAAGILGIALGFAARETVANFLGGLALYFDDTYRVGDFLELDNGKSGSVMNVGIRSTTLRSKDNIQINVPNSVLSNSQVTNKSAPKEEIRIRVPIGVAYGTDIDDLEAILLGVAEDTDLVLSNPVPSTRFTAFADSAIQYELLVWVRSPLQIPIVRDQINSAVYKRLAEAGIEIPYPKQDVIISE